MKRLTATEAARQFSDLLDQVERDGETFVVERRGRPIASIAPTAAASGAAIKTILRSSSRDETWGAELADLRLALQPEDRRWTG